MGTAPDPTGQNWSEAEIDLIVSDYFDMLSKELAGQHYVKRRHNEAVQARIGRSHASVEFKHQNISAVLVQLGLPRIAGYLPKPNYQGALIDGVERYLDRTAWHGQVMSSPDRRLRAVAEPRTLFFDDPPTPVPRESLTEPLRRLIRKFDPAERDARNRALGRSGEELVLASERSRLIHIGRPDLAHRVKWFSEEVGDGAGYDILSFSRDGEERFLEVKTTVGEKFTPFYLSENERAFSLECPNAFRIVRVYDFAKSPRAFRLLPPLEASVILTPVVHKASFA